MNLRSLSVKTLFLDCIFAVVGSFLYAVSVQLFIDPNMISVGGFTGIGTLLHHLWPVIPIGVSVWVMNLPLFVLSWKKLGSKFVFKTAFATAAMSVALDLTEFLPSFTENKLLAAIAGGVGTGIGLGIIFSRSMATGGTDLLAKLIKGKFRGLGYGKIILVFDATILIASAIIYRDPWSILYSAITVWLISAVIDGILNGIDRAKSVTVITKRKKEVLEGIFSTFDRGATVWQAEGGYTGEPKDAVLIVVRNYELFLLKRTVKEIDPDAFMIISDATEVMGLGFREGPPEE